MLHCNYVTSRGKGQYLSIALSKGWGAGNVSKFKFKRPNRKYSVFSLRLRKMSSAAPFRASNGARLHLLSGFVVFSRHFRFDNVKGPLFFSFNENTGATCFEIEF